MGDYEGIAYLEKRNLRRKGCEISGSHGFHLGRFGGYFIGEPDCSLLRGLDPIASGKGKKILSWDNISWMWAWFMYFIFAFFVNR
jgi:hypothetical protein